MNEPISDYLEFHVWTIYIYIYIYISRGESQKGINDIFGEMEIYSLYQMKALDELFYWQKYCHPWVYNFLL